MKRALLISTLLFAVLELYSQDTASNNGFLQSLYTESFAKDSNPYSSKKWYETIQIGGYIQFRYNGFKTNPDLECEQCDPTYGGDKGFLIRRLRIKLQGWVHPKVFFYIQPDFAADGKNLGQLRDGYFDLYMGKKNEVWFRLGQSKIPYGFENLQSSQNRIPLDRDDPINSAFKNERDMMMALYWTPQEIKKRFRELKSKGLKGSGDYGMLGVGLFNGQTANAAIPDDNESRHFVLRFTYPFLFPNGQYLELSAQGYYGQYQATNVTEGVVAKGEYAKDGITPLEAKNAFFDDSRVAFSAIYYPQPVGFQAEYNIGIGPEYDAATNSIDVKPLHGGYLTLYGNMLLWGDKFYPFVRMQYYKGGKKFELDARSQDTKEVEIGTEWHPNNAFELTVNYTYADRKTSDATEPTNFHVGHMVRIQAQLNY